MLQKFLAYIMLWLSFQLLVGCQMIPKQRQWHTATFVDSKLYILGGSPVNNISVALNEFFYLDVSGPFNTKSLPWQNLSGNTIPAHGSATTVVGGANNNTLFLYGGVITDATMALVCTFNPNSATWDFPKIVGVD